MGLFGGSESKSKTKVTNTTEVTSPVASSVEGSELFQNVTGNIEYSPLFQPTDLGAVDSAFSFANRVTDYQGETVAGVLNLVDRHFERSSELITLESDRAAEAAQQSAELAQKSLEKVSSAYATKEQGGIDTPKLLTGLALIAGAVFVANKIL